MDPGLLFDAFVWGSDAAIKFRFLLSRGLDLTTTIAGKWGMPLHVAALFADKEVIRILLDLGTDPTSRSYCTKFKNNSPVEVAEWKMRASHEGSSTKRTYESVMELLESEKEGRIVCQLLYQRGQMLRTVQSRLKRRKKKEMYSVLMTLRVGRDLRIVEQFY
ncbi:uncharacterized protein BO88DRAFT_464713 [Aspergillus vadensis CBS 113365]|uniref:Uncharacterized protein n=1 Tax=Aspergillus vadensis (strain CBS 113365 / IMI 142717 / IBT 24658) TaxID=1448311 RepID=A0A319B6G0_ASPVC|nr:hypothetical protein BO88DRAFT_464713 [Aspergillus vadensis CBS 113365]PYH67919.1 hypothetical protein BO88DRAFT_464713 [Aspergillus vadensis CBS 113365]